MKNNFRVSLTYKTKPYPWHWQLYELQQDGSWYPIGKEEYASTRRAAIRHSKYEAKKIKRTRALQKRAEETNVEFQI